MFERINVLSGGGDSWGPKKYCIRWDPSPHGKGRGFDAALVKLLPPLVIVMLSPNAAFPSAYG